MYSGKNCKSYFVKDESLTSVDDDYFRHYDVAKNIKMVIENTQPPYNIALIGKWGLGKSSVINMVIEPLKRDPDNYIVQEINAWKYEKDSLCKVFLKQLWQAISEKPVKTIDNIKKEIADILSSNDDSKGFNKETKKLLKYTFLFFVATVLSFLIYKVIQGVILGFPNTFFLFIGKTFLSYCKNVGTILLFPILVALGKLLLDKIVDSKTKRIEVNIPLETADDYELFIEEKIKEKLKKNPHLKIVTVIDDLDRLSIEKIVEALDALKAFININSCVFIVPFDDEILKKALDTTKLQKINTDSNRIVESELILDKLFQFKIYLLPLIKFDIKEYAIELAEKRMTDFIIEYCDKESIKNIIKYVLIHSNVTTPRQVKKILNSFANNLIVAINREYNGRAEKGLASSYEGQLIIAKLSVLQADFNEFYDLLFKNSEYLYTMLQIHKDQESYDMIPDDLKLYFNQNGDHSKIKDVYLPLINFLTSTSQYTTNNLLKYLYLAQDRVSVLTGDENQRKLISASISKNYETSRILVKETPNLALALINQLIYTDDIDELAAHTITAINISDDTGYDYKQTIAHEIDVKAARIVKDALLLKYDNLSVNNLLSLMRIVNNHSGLLLILSEYLKRSDWNEAFYSNLKIMINNDVLIGDLKILVKSIIERLILLDSVYTYKVIDMIDLSNHIQFEYYFGLNYLQMICNEIIKRNNFDSIILESLSNVFSYFIKWKNDLNKSIDYIIPIFQYPAAINTLNQMFTKNICDELDLLVSTQISDIIIRINISSCIEDAFNLLEKIHFQIDTNSSNVYDQFFVNNIENKDISGIIKICGIRGYYSQLPIIIQELINRSFSGNEQSLSLFEDVNKYLTLEQVEGIFMKLNEKVGFVNNYDYKNECRLVSILSKDERYEESLLDLAYNVINILNTSYNMSNYFLLAYNIMSFTKKYLTQQIVDKYLMILTSSMTIYPIDAVNAVRMILDKISDENFINLTPQLLHIVTVDNFDSAFYILKLKSHLFKIDTLVAKQYIDFLLNSFEITDSPDEIIRELFHKFDYINQENVLFRKISIANNVNVKYAESVIAKFIDNYDSIEKVFSFLNDCIGISDASLGDVILQLKVHNLQNIAKHVGSDEIISNEDIKFLILQLCGLRKELISPKQSIDIAKKLLSDYDEPEIVDATCNILKGFGSLYFREVRKELTNVLYNCFHLSTSNSVRECIIVAVSILKLKGQFREFIKTDNNEMEFYRNNVIQG